eukprot:9711704-Alexandrium_andersonii.AAC.1
MPSGWGSSVQLAAWRPLAAWLHERSIEALEAPPEGHGWGTEVGAWLLGSAGAAGWLAAEPGEAAEGLAAVGFADQRIHKPTA